MPFIPDSAFGILYAMACIGVAGVSFTRQSTHARAISLMFVVHWLSMRAINATDHNDAALWVAHDVATVLALSLYGRTRQSKLAFACAAVFFVVMLFDQYWLLFDSSFTANAAVAEAGGYLAFLMIMGATIGGSNGIDNRLRDSGYGAVTVACQSRGAISRYSGLSGQALASHQNHQKEIGGT